jgi:hypothetical protein
MRQPEKREGSCGLPSVACLSAENVPVMFFTKAIRARIQACSLDILEKGKPVARPGRKAQGRLISAGSPVAERVKNQKFGTRRGQRHFTKLGSRR